MICVECGERQKEEVQCTHCGGSPFLEERYALLSILGQGAEGVTYKARHIETQELVVIKERLWKPQHQQARIRRLEREAKVLSEMRHHQIPTHHEHFLRKEGRRTTLYIVQEFVEGTTLFSLLKRKRFTKTEVWELAEQLFDILVYLQELSPPIIHRDIKPSNIIYKEPEGLYYLIDFGSVRDALSDPDIGSSTYAGTFGYMPPEQVYGQSDCRTDLYSLGAMLIELLTRQSPADLLQYDQTFSWLHRVSLTSPYINFLQKMCARNPAERYHNARQARSILRSIRIQPPKKIQKATDVELSLPSLDDFRAMIREELEQAVETKPQKLEEGQAPGAVGTSIATEEKRSSSDPLLLTIHEHNLLPRKKGWWSPKPPRKLDEPIEPLHPAVQLSVMALAMIGSSILIQFLLIPT